MEYDISKEELQATHDYHEEKAQEAKRLAMREIARRAYELNEQAKTLNKELSDLKNLLKNQGSAQYDEFFVLVEHRSRESFSIKDAKNDLSPALWAQIEGFVKTTEFEQVKIVRH